MFEFVQVFLGILLDKSDTAPAADIDPLAVVIHIQILVDSVSHYRTNCLRFGDPVQNDTVIFKLLYVLFRVLFDGGDTTGAADIDPPALDIGIHLLVDRTAHDRTDRLRFRGLFENNPLLFENTNVLVRLFLDQLDTPLTADIDPFALYVRIQIPVDRLAHHRTDTLGNGSSILRLNHENTYHQHKQQNENRTWYDQFLHDASAYFHTFTSFQHCGRRVCQTGLQFLFKTGRACALTYCLNTG